MRTSSRPDRPPADRSLNAALPRLGRVASPATYRPAPGSIPDSPGVYRFRDENRRVIYVGKAKSLRSRLSSYFQDTSNLHPRTLAMVTSGAAVEWTVVNTEVEALQLEHFDQGVRSALQRPLPRRQVVSEPCGDVVRGVPAPDGDARCQAQGGALLRAVLQWAIRETLDLLLRVFPASHVATAYSRRAKVTVPAGLHRQVLRPLRRARDRG